MRVVAASLNSPMIVEGENTPLIVTETVLSKLASRVTDGAVVNDTDAVRPSRALPRIVIVAVMVSLAVTNSCSVGETDRRLARIRLVSLIRLSAPRFNVVVLVIDSRSIRAT